MTADDWPHFDPDERTETILHLQARQELEELGAAQPAAKEVGHDDLA